MEGFVFPRGFASKFAVYSFPAQLIPSGAWTQIQYRIALFDLLNEVDLVTNFDWIPKQTGYYLLSATASFGALPLGTLIGVRIEENGNPIAVELQELHNNALETVTTRRLHHCTIGWAYTADVYQNTGFNQNLSVSHLLQRFTGFRVA